MEADRTRCGPGRHRGLDAGRLHVQRNPSEIVPVATALDGRQFDLVVIGGGITGAGIFRDAALRGMDVALFEKRDFASGTSSRSSKLIHGGLRYLQQGDLHLIYESVNERRRLRSLARHLVRPMGFWFPRYAGQRPGPGIMRIGLFLYEALTGFRVDARHRAFSATDTIAHVPELREDGLRGSLLYYDAATSDARLVWENIVGGEEAGGLAFNYSPVVEAERRDGWWHISIRRGEQTETVLTRTVVAAVGPWGNRALGAWIDGLDVSLRPTKGIHLVLRADRLRIPDAVAFEHPRDRRATFIIPGRHFLYCGTTDTDYDGDVDEPEVTADDAQYLLELLQWYFPEADISEQDVVATWAGLRPLVQEAGKSAYQTSREHQIVEPAPCFFSIEGGKLTTYRLMAAEAVDAAQKRLPADRQSQLQRCQTAREPLPGARGLFDEEGLADLIARIERLCGDAELAQHLAMQYGTRFVHVWPYIEAQPRRLAQGLPWTEGELTYIVEHERVAEVEDVLLRRTELYYQAPSELNAIAEAVADMLADRHDWSPGDRAAALQRWHERVQRGLAFRERGDGAT
ncbi:MAG: glycerol-3-phosphate dehydrogenase/oxidase [Candidatus Dadabacteria bacterium]|nr:MAG: glycerol-3-phosphate dehydrogenase/oxidase [Candidatus Dadabacteria bacterium]